MLLRDGLKLQQKILFNKIIFKLLTAPAASDRQGCL